jgi:hypothetical protein
MHGISWHIADNQDTIHEMHSSAKTKEQNTRNKNAMTHNILNH